jgi:pimeloyl-ACP methyl ester carboxylesterase
MNLRGRLKRRYGREPLWLSLQPMTTGSTVAADGTVLRWQSFGGQSAAVAGEAAPTTAGEPLAAQPAGLPIVCANGIGVRYPGLVLQIAHLRARHQVVTWDYRGAGDTLLPRPDAALDMPTHARDLLTLTDALGLREFVLLGWSMGVQVGLEVIRQRPAAVRGLVALFGTYGRPFHTGALAPVAPAIERLLRLLVAVPQAVTLATQLGALLPELAVPFLRRIRFVSELAERSVFLSNVQDVADADHRAYLRTLLHLCEHDAADVLPRVACPTLIVTGEHDGLTPPAVAREMAARIPDAECVVLPEASHFGLIEPPREVNPHIDRLLARVSAAGARPPRPTAAPAETPPGARRSRPARHDDWR